MNINPSSCPLVTITVTTKRTVHFHIVLSNNCSRTHILVFLFHFFFFFFSSRLPRATVVLQYVAHAAFNLTEKKNVFDLNKFKRENKIHKQVINKAAFTLLKTYEQQFVFPFHFACKYELIFVIIFICKPLIVVVVVLESFSYGEISLAFISE